MPSPAEGPSTSCRLSGSAGEASVCGVARPPGEPITVEDIADAGPAPRSGDMLFIATGWDRYFDTAGYHDYPFLDPEVAEWAVETGVSVVATDTLSPDLPAARRPNGYGYPVHRR